MYYEILELYCVKGQPVFKTRRVRVSKRDRYISAHNMAKENCANDRDVFYGLSNCDPDFSAFRKKGPSIEMCAVNDFIDGRFCPPR